MQSPSSRTRLKTQTAKSRRFAKSWVIRGQGNSITADMQAAREGFEVSRWFPRVGVCAAGGGKGERSMERGPHRRTENELSQSEAEPFLIG